MISFSIENEFMSPENGRAATIWGRFAAFRIDFGALLQRSAWIGGRFAPSCLNLGPSCSVLHQCPCFSAF